MLGLFIAFELHAHATDPACDLDHVSELTEIQQLLEWSSAATLDIRNAPCKTQTLPSDDEMKEFIKSKSGYISEDAVSGVKLKDSRTFIEAFKDFTIAKDMFGNEEKPALQKKIQSSYKINPGCDQVLCAMERIWGPELALKMLYIKLKHNYNTSELAFEHSSRFAPHELNQVLLAMEDLPSNLVPLGRPNQRLTHYSRGKNYEGYTGKVNANAVIMLFDPWHEQDPESMQFTIFHEMSHNMARKLDGLDESPAWLKLSGWVKKGNDWESNPKACHISNYATANPWEDFSEVTSAYRYNARELKEKCPEKYAFVKSHLFNNKEYTDISHCSPLPEEKLKRAQQDFSSQLSLNLEDQTYPLAEIKKTCQATFKTYPVNNKDLTSCALKLQIAKTPINHAELLAKAGIKDTTVNRGLVQEAISSRLIQDPQLQQKMNSKTSKLKHLVSEISQSSLAATSKFIRPPDDKYASLIMINEKCAKILIEGEKEKARDCQIQSFVEEDRSYQKWKMGVFQEFMPSEVFAGSAKDSLITAREEYLTKLAKDEPVMQKAWQKLEGDYNKRMMGHRHEATRELSKLDNWKSLSPAEFCQKTYGRGSPLTSIYGFKTGGPLPRFQKGCVAIQSKKSVRFELSEKEWRSVLEGP